MIISSAGGSQELQNPPPGLIPPLRRKMNCVFYPKIIKYKKTCRNMDNIQLNILILTRGVMPAGTPHLEAIKDQSIILLAHPRVYKFLVQGHQTFLGLFYS